MSELRLITWLMIGMLWLMLVTSGGLFLYSKRQQTEIDQLRTLVDRAITSGEKAATGWENCEKRQK